MATPKNLSKVLAAATRERVGKGAARDARRRGRTPAVIYGAGEEPVSIELDANETRKMIYAGGFLTTPIEVEVGGNRTRVIPRDYQLHPVKDTPMHVDFLRLKRGQTIRVEVPVRFINEETAPGLREGGVLNIVRHTVEMNVPADAIPEAITADLAGLTIGDSLHISAVTLPEGAKPVITDRDFTIATIAPPQAEEPETVATAEDAPAADAEKK